MPDDETTALTAYRDAIAATDAAEHIRDKAKPGDIHHTQEMWEFAAEDERLAARAYLAARDASVAGQVNGEHDAHVD